MTEERSHWINRFSTIIDENKRSVQLGLCTVAVIGISYSFRAVRPFKKFCRADQIPLHFIKKHIKLNGRVLQLEIGDDILLRIDHKPVFLSRLRKISYPGLGVKLAGANISSNGISWLSNVVVDNNVDFILLKRSENYVTCRVLNHNGDITQQLIRLGFASVGPFDVDLNDDLVYKKYYESLLKFEHKAEKNKQGMWDDGKFDLKLYIKDFVKNIIWKKI